MQPELDLIGGFHAGPLFVIRKERAPVRPKGKEGIVHRMQTRRATPPWADMAAINEFYAQARKLTHETGELYVVDHIVPLIGKQAGCVIVSGLHVHWNMRVVHWRANAQKLNWFWPDMPFEQLDLI